MAFVAVVACAFVGTLWALSAWSDAMLTSADSGTAWAVPAPHDTADGAPARDVASPQYGAADAADDTAGSARDGTGGRSSGGGSGERS